MRYSIYNIHTEKYINCDVYDGVSSCEYLNEKGEYEFWRDPNYTEYVMKYGHHFNEKLSEYASKKMEIKKGDPEHYWTREQVITAMEKMGLSIPMGWRACDAHYLANMAYADYFGSSLPSEELCLKFVHDFMTDPDGYNCKAFFHYTTDIMSLGEFVNWAEML